MRKGSPESVSRSPSQRRLRYGRVTKVYTSAEGGSYQVDVEIEDSATIKHVEADVGVGGNGEVRGIEEGTRVSVKSTAGEEEKAVVESVVYRPDSTPPMMDRGDWRNVFGNSTIEITDSKILVGASGGRGQLSSGLTIDTAEGLFYFADGTKKGLHSDGAGNFTWTFNTMTMPGPAAGGGGGQVGTGGQAGPTTPQQNTVTGTLEPGGSQTFDFSGSIESISPPTGLNITENGQEVDPETYTGVSSTPTQNQEQTNTTP